MKWISGVLKALFIIPFVWIAIQLIVPSEQVDTISKDHELVSRLNFIENELKKDHLGKRMQVLFPEGYVFIHAIYGLSWCELYPKTNDKSLKKRAYSEAIYAFKSIHSKEGKQFFQKHLTPEYGIYYKGWSNYLLSKIIACKGRLESSQELIQLYDKNCSEIIQALKNSETPYLESYAFDCWPADNFIAIGSLKHHNEFKKIISDWIPKVKERLDPYTGIIPHKFDALSDSILEGSRGCSSSLSLLLLSEIDSSFASNQAKKYHEHFLFNRFGFPAIREYPKGIKGSGDVDSGPVIFDVGFAGTIVGIGAIKKLGYSNLSDKLYNTVCAFGFETGLNKKKVLGGIMPMGDAFLTWSRLQSPKFNFEVEYQSSFTAVWFYIFLAIILLLIYPSIRQKVLALPTNFLTKK